MELQLPTYQLGWLCDFADESDANLWAIVVIEERPAEETVGQQGSLCLKLAGLSPKELTLPPHEEKSASDFELELLSQARNFDLIW